MGVSEQEVSSGRALRLRAGVASAAVALVISFGSIALAPAANAGRLPGSIWLDSPSSWGQAWNECRRIYPQTKSTRRDDTIVFDGKRIDRWGCYDTP